MPKKRKRKRHPLLKGRDSFPSRMTEKETITTACIMGAHLIIMPILLGLIPDETVERWGLVMLNCIMYGTTATLMVLTLMRYLRADFDIMLNWKKHTVRGVLLAFFVSYGISLVISGALGLFGVTLGSTANNDMVLGFVRRDYNRMFAAIVLLAPLAEEPFFRGIIFGKLIRKQRLAAYVASTLAFAFYHVWQYAIQDPRALLDMINYIPVSIALAWCYEQGGNIWAPIAFHSLNNLVSLYVLKAAYF